MGSPVGALLLIRIPRDDAATMAAIDVRVEIENCETGAIWFSLTPAAEFRRFDGVDLSNLRHYIRVYDDGLEPALCRQMIESFAALQRFQNKNGQGVRAGLDESSWTELNVTPLADQSFAAMFRKIFDDALERYNRDVALTIPIPNTRVNSELVIKRYRANSVDRFQLHFDANHHLANRYMVLLWYLNDVTEGGETRFPQLDFSVAPRAGRLLMFPPYWMYQHEGIQPRSGDKYILSSYLLYNVPAMGPRPIPESESATGTGTETSSLVR
jgi:prolyl 4-hydroxylase